MSFAIVFQTDVMMHGIFNFAGKQKMADKYKRIMICVTITQKMASYSFLNSILSSVDLYYVTYKMISFFFRGRKVYLMDIFDTGNNYVSEYLHTITRN